MISSYSNDQQPMANTGSYNFNNINSNPPQAPQLNSYGTEYMNSTRENRSKYGNYLDNALSYDPHKEKQSAFNVVYQSDIYNPWGKPGGGAPKLNNNTGQLQTKIAGTLQWNLNGETESDRIARSMANRSKTNQNLNMYKKNAFPSNMSPRNMNDAVRTNTTYNYNFREPIGNEFGGNQEMAMRTQPMPQQSQAMPQQSQAMPQQSIGGQSQPPMQMSQQSQGMPNYPMTSPGRMQTNSFDLTPKLQHEAEARSLNRSQTNNIGEPFRPKGFSELNRLANKLNTDNQPTTTYPNMSYWFGRTGQHKTTIGSFPAHPASDFSSDPRRRKLLDQLEHRSPRDVPKIYGLDNSKLPQSTNLAFVNDPHSNHRNMYENAQ